MNNMNTLYWFIETETSGMSFTWF